MLPDHDQSHANVNVVYLLFHLFNENSSCEIQNNIDVQVKKAGPDNQVNL